MGSEGRIENAAARARELGMGFVGINSNDPIMYESDNWDSMVKRAGKGMSYAYLHDETQAIAHAYGAERTPEFYLLCLLYTSPSPRDLSTSRMPSSA